MIDLPATYLIVLCVIGTCTGDISDTLHYYETMKSSDIGSRVRRSADPNPAFHMREVWFSALGRSFHMYLKQSHVLSDDFTARVLHQNGTSTYFKVDKSRFLTGKLKGDDSSGVKVHWEGDYVMTASIETDEDTYVVEPSWRHLPLSDNYSMIAYKQSHVKWNVSGTEGGARGKLCGVEDRNMHASVDDIRRMSDDDDNIKLYPGPDNHQSRKRRYKRHVTCVGTHLNCRLTVVADYRFYQAIGRGDHYQTSHYIGSLIDRVNFYYQRTRFPDDGARADAYGLGFELVEMVILDSYTNTRGQHYNMEDRPADMDKVLDWFGNAHHKNFSKVCLAHLLTYQQFSGQLGLAYIASSRGTTIGGICSRVGYIGGKRQAVNTGMSSFQNPGGSTAASLQATLTVTHELGHNWGSEHDPDTSECSPWFYGKYIMHPHVITGNDRNNKYFSTCSKQYIYNVLRNKGYQCLSEKSAGQGFLLCGNGRIDGDEECDAGYNGDRCCEKTCKLKDGAVCSYTNYPCCNTNCQIAPSNKTCISSLDNFDCKKEAKCSGTSFKLCPEPDNKDDNTTCHNGKCRGGVCLDVCQQKNQISCACTEEATACMECCGNSTHCHTIENAKQLPDGSPCFNGFCRKGKCEKSTGFISRLYTILEYISVDYVVQFMRNNIVWVILLLCTILWIIFIAVIERYDKKTEKKEKQSRENMTRLRGELTLPGTEDKVEKRGFIDRLGKNAQA